MVAKDGEKGVDKVKPSRRATKDFTEERGKMEKKPSKRPVTTIVDTHKPPRIPKTGGDD